MPRAFSNSVRTDDYAEDIHASLPAYHPIRITHHLASAPEYNLVYQDVYSAGNKIMCDFGPFTVNRSYKNKSEAFKLPKDYVWPPVDIMAHNLDTIREIMSQITPTKINAGFDKIVNPLTGQTLRELYGYPTLEFEKVLIRSETSSNMQKSDDDYFEGFQSFYISLQITLTTTPQFDETLHEFQSPVDNVASKETVRYEFFEPICKMVDRELAEVFSSDIMYQLVKRTGHRLSSDLYRLHWVERVYECNRLDEEYATIIENALIARRFADRYGFSALFTGRQQPEYEYPAHDSIFPHKDMHAFRDSIMERCFFQSAEKVTEEAATAVSNEEIEC